MFIMKEIKWGCIQPLTGGMYIGAEYAIGKPASWVISYPGLCGIKYKQDGTIGSAGNEYNFLQWCKKRDEVPPYFVFDRKIFDTNIDVDNINILLDENWSTAKKPDFKNTDIIVSVPVCSGLSQATIAEDDTKDERNSNMIFNATYALKVIKPKVYIFENAPALYSHNGEHVREILNKLGKECGYSVGYFKTDTQYHDNPQKRPRTFVMFLQYRGKDKGFPTFNYEHKTTSIKEYFGRISKNASQQDLFANFSESNQILLGFIKSKFGDNYREVCRSVMSTITRNNLWDEAIEYANNFDADEASRNKVAKFLNHARSKLEMGKNYYSITPWWAETEESKVPSCMFKTIYSYMHPTEDRLLSVREWLHLMGHPEDFELYGEVGDNISRIGQNVPVNTAKYIVSEAVRFVNNWDTIERNNPEVYMFDNTKYKETKPSKAKRLF